MLYLPIKYAQLLEGLPNIHKTGSVRGMKNKGYWRKSDIAIKCGNYIYNIDSLNEDEKIQVLEKTQN